MNFALVPGHRHGKAKVNGDGSSILFDAGAGTVFFRSMNMVTSRHLPARPLAVPNLLTYARIVAVPAVVACLYWQDILQGGLWLRWLALFIFVSAAVTDVLDGYFARKWGEQSSFGRMLDPIADKLLVASCLLMLAADGTIRGWSLWAASSSCAADPGLGTARIPAELRVSVPVTQLAKWKTTLQLVAVGFHCGQGRRPIVPVVTPMGSRCSVGLLTLYTGWDYFRAGLRHLIEE